MSEDYLHGVETVEITDGTRPIQTPKSSVQFFAGTAEGTDETLFPIGKSVLVDSAMAEKLGPGTLRDNYLAMSSLGVRTAIMQRVPVANDPIAQMQHVLGDPIAMTGVYGALSASSQLGVTPRIISAPGFTGARPDNNANPIGAAMTGIADQLRAVAVVDGPNTTEAEALAAANDYGSARTYMVDPFVKVFRDGEFVDVPASAFASAAISVTDFWKNPSSTKLGISGTARPITFGMSNRGTETNRLNEAGIATIVNKDGFRLWGQRSMSDDPLWAFLQVRRTCDMVYEALEKEMLWAIAQNLTPQLARSVVESVNAYLRRLKAIGALAGGVCWLDENLNTAETLKAGKLYVNFDLEPFASLEHLIFRAYRNDEYIEEQFDGILIAA